MAAEPTQRLSAKQAAKHRSYYLVITPLLSVSAKQLRREYFTALLRTTYHVLRTTYYVPLTAHYLLPGAAARVAPLSAHLAARSRAEPTDCAARRDAAAAARTAGLGK
eukprot:scaffold32229_cov25-Phaeocystis_antarctica.AAC.1